MAKTKKTTTKVEHKDGKTEITFNALPAVLGIRIDLKGNIGEVDFTPSQARILYEQLGEVFEPQRSIWTVTEPPKSGVYSVTFGGDQDLKRVICVVGKERGFHRP